MTDRIAHAVADQPRRGIAVGPGIAAFIAVVVALASGLSTASRAARASKHAVSAARAQQIDSKVGALINKMTVAEKFGQLEMSGPTGRNGAPGQTLLDEAKARQVGTVLDLVGVDNINQVQQAALQSRLHIPLIFGLDAIHGYRTMFPVPAGEASSWDPRTVPNDAGCVIWCPDSGHHRTTPRADRGGV